MKQYRVDLKGHEKRQFSLGGGRYITLNDGALLKDGHEFIKLYPSFVKEIKVDDANQDSVEDEASENQEQILLNEHPLEDAKQDSVEDEATDNQETETEASEETDYKDETADDVESMEDKIAAMTSKDEVESFGRELGVELDKRKGLDTMKKVLLEELAKKGE